MGMNKRGRARLLLRYEVCDLFDLPHSAGIIISR